MESFSNGSFLFHIILSLLFHCVCVCVYIIYSGEMVHHRIQNFAHLNVFKIDTFDIYVRCSTKHSHIMLPEHCEHE